MQGLSSDYASSSQAQRDRMMSATQRLQQSDNRLQEGKRLLAETEVGCLLGKGDWCWANLRVVCAKGEARRLTALRNVGKRGMRKPRGRARQAEQHATWGLR